MVLQEQCGLGSREGFLEEAQVCLKAWEAGVVLGPPKLEKGVFQHPQIIPASEV